MSKSFAPVSINTNIFILVKEKLQKIDPLVSNTLQSFKTCVVNNADLILSQYLNRPVDPYWSITTKEAIAETVIEVALNPEAGAKLIGSVEMTAIETGCFGCLSWISK